MYIRQQVEYPKVYGIYLKPGANVTYNICIWRMDVTAKRAYICATVTQIECALLTHSRRVYGI